MNSPASTSSPKRSKSKDQRSQVHDNISTNTTSLTPSQLLGLNSTAVPPSVATSNRIPVSQESSLDMKDFPSLSNRTTPNPLPASRNYGVISKGSCEPSQEFHIHQEDFPALPGLPTSSEISDASSMFSNAENAMKASLLSENTYDIGMLSKVGASSTGVTPGHPSTNHPGHAPSSSTAPSNMPLPSSCSISTTTTSSSTPVDCITTGMSGLSVGVSLAGSTTAAGAPSPHHAGPPPTTVADHGPLSQLDGLVSNPLVVGGGGDAGSPLDNSQRGMPTSANNSTQMGIQTHADGLITNIPSGMVGDQFGIVGLLTFIRAAETERTPVALAPGIDLTTLGLNLHSAEPAYNLYSTFQSPWAEYPCRTQDIEYPVPHEYLTNKDIGSKLAPIKLNQYGEDLIFLLFYMNGGDVLQLAAATELFDRDWRFHKIHKTWLTRASTDVLKVKTNTYERGMYYFFDAVNWIKIPKEIHLEYDQLEERPQLPAPPQPGSVEHGNPAPPILPAATTVQQQLSVQPQ